MKSIKNKKKLIVSLFTIIIFIGLINIPHLTFDYDNRNSAYNLVRLHDINVENVLSMKKYDNLYAIIYRTNFGKDKLIIFNKLSFYGGADLPNDSFGTYHTNEDNSIFIIFGNNNMNAKTYTYNTNDIEIINNCDSPYVLDIYILDNKYDLGEGKAFSDEGEMLFKF